MNSAVSVACEVQLSRQIVENIHLEGGSLLGVSRGGSRTTDIVDSIEKKGINMLFVLGGNGTHAGALAIHNEVKVIPYLYPFVQVKCRLFELHRSLQESAVFMTSQAVSH